jgi:hypothetical protein
MRAKIEAEEARMQAELARRNHEEMMLGALGGARP